ncbi:MAG: alpha/beta family hydrolase [Bacteroidota bacterium]
MSTSQLLKFPASKSSGEVSALFLNPPKARVLLVFAHGAGAGMRHPFMEAVSQRLADAGIATFRYQFPYMEKKSGRPDPQPILLATVRSAVAAAGQVGGSLPMIAGGKSMGGRMTSLAASMEPLSGVRGLVFFGFPLHPPGKPGVERAKHLSAVTIPMLFLQGTRDKLADLTLLRPICDKLPRAEIAVIEGADHSFRMTKSSGTTDEQVLEMLVQTVNDWAAAL